MVTTWSCCCWGNYKHRGVSLSLFSCASSGASCSASAPHLQLSTPASLHAIAASYSRPRTWM